MEWIESVGCFILGVSALLGLAFAALLCYGLYEVILWIGRH